MGFHLLTYGFVTKDGLSGDSYSGLVLDTREVRFRLVAAQCMQQHLFQFWNCHLGAQAVCVPLQRVTFFVCPDFRLQCLADTPHSSTFGSAL